MSNNNSLKVLLAGAECAPFVKLGGLADVMGTLPKELNQIGADARVIMPFHSQIEREIWRTDKTSGSIYNI